MYSIDDEDIDLNVFEDVETVSFADWHRALYDRNQSKRAIDEEYVEEIEAICITDSTEATTSVIVGSKKRTRKTSESDSDPKTDKRQKMNDNDVDDEETTKSKMLINLELKCPQSECNMVFESMEQLYQHQKSVHGVLPFPCIVPECSEQFASRRQLDIHYSIIHSDYNNLTCAQCNLKMKNLLQLYRHKRDYHKFGRFHCPHSVCTFDADLRFKVQNHRSSVHVQHTCSVSGCGRKFYGLFYLEKHYQSSH